MASLDADPTAMHFFVTTPATETAPAARLLVFKGVDETPFDMDDLPPFVGFDSDDDFDDDDDDRGSFGAETPATNLAPPPSAPALPRPPPDDEAEREDALLDALSVCIANALKIEDPNALPGKPLAQLLLHEGTLEPNRKRIQRMAELMEGEKWCQKTMATAGCMLQRTIHARDVNLDSLPRRESWMDSQFWDKESFLGTHVCQIEVGAIGPRLVLRSVRERALRWLRAVDAVACAAFAEPNQQSAAVEGLVPILADELAQWVACTEPDGSVRLTDDAFDRLAAQAVADCADDKRIAELESLTALAALAEGAELTEDLIAPLLALENERPAALGPLATDAELGLSLLLCALRHDDKEVGKTLLKKWREDHSAFAANVATAAEQALASQTPPLYLKSLTPPGPTLKGSKLLPTVPWMYDDVVIGFLPTHRQEPPPAALSPAARRRVRLISIVRDLVSFKVIKRGVICSDIVRAAAQCAFCEAEEVGRQISVFDRTLAAPGFEMWLLRLEIQNLAGYLSSEVSEALSALSWFSTSDVRAFFSRKRHGAALAQRVRARATVKIPAFWETFADMAWAVLSPVFEQRRAAAGVSPFHGLSPAAEALLSIPKLRAWTGAAPLVLSEDDLLCTSPWVSALLRTLAKAGKMVEWRRVCVGHAQKSVEPHYVFSNPAMVTWLRRARGQA